MPYACGVFRPQGDQEWASVTFYICARSRRSAWCGGSASSADPCLRTGSLSGRRLLAVAAALGSRPVRTQVPNNADHRVERQRQNTSSGDRPAVARYLEMQRALHGYSTRIHDA